MAEELIDALHNRAIRATVTKIVDGDTFTADLELGFGVLLRQYVRIARLDTPEIDASASPEALKAKQQLLDLIPPASSVWLLQVQQSTDKYARLLAEVLLPDKTPLIDHLDPQWIIDPKTHRWLHSLRKGNL